MSYNDFRELNRNQRNGRFLGFQSPGLQEKGERRGYFEGSQHFGTCPNGQRSPRRKLLALLVLVSRHRKAQAAIISNVSLTHVQRQPQESHSNSICHILQESKHNRIISSEHKAGFILGI